MRRRFTRHYLKNPRHRRCGCFVWSDYRMEDGKLIFSVGQGNNPICTIIHLERTKIKWVKDVLKKEKKNGVIDL